MPHIFNSYKNTMDAMLRRRAKQVQQQHCPGLLSVPARTLTLRDFKIKFLAPHPDDDLVDDLEVMIFGHHDEDRIAEGRPDEIAAYLEHELEWELGNGLTVSVSVLLTEIGYAGHQMQELKEPLSAWAPGHGVAPRFVGAGAIGGDPADGDEIVGPGC